ncbi:MAG: low molecular weight phosphotyrosine protein phosphatase [Gammaproteobacteria bacterium]|nr:low molecular weight phosphotyrosine protein phosphatase [Gammaproteobacteria bacterium]
MVRVLFVCLGNICRSPMAEGVFRRLVEQAGYADRVHIDSAGTHAYHIDQPPDLRAQAAAARRGVDIAMLRGRQALAEDLLSHDYVLAMDDENYAHLRALCPPEHEHKVRLFLEFATRSNERFVPDPYYGGASGFDRVLDLIEDAAEGLLADIRKRTS